MDAKFLMVFLMAEFFLCINALPPKPFYQVDGVGMNANPIGPCYCFGLEGTYYWNNCPPGWLPCGSPVQSRQCCV
ncbi:hypothetical protein ABFA07_018192 [Porites harrisoni]